jgi:tetratricopeptide (TPR) repeat protein
MEAHRHPMSARANFDAAHVVSRHMELHRPVTEDDYGTARSYYLQSARLAPNAIAPLISFMALDAMVHQRVDKPTYVTLLQRLRSGRPDAAAGYNLRHLAHVVNEWDKVISLDTARSLFDAALANPKLSARDQGVGWVGYGLFESHRGNDKELGLSYLKKAVDAAPGLVENWVILGAQLADMQRYDEAAHALNQAERIDRYHHFQDQISNVRSYIPQAAR